MTEIGKIRIIAPAGNPEAADLAETLKRGLESFRVPGRLAGRTGVRRVEETDEEWLIVVCTPETPGDELVNREIGAWIERGRFGRILTLLAEGTPDTSFPPSLIYEKKEDGSIVEHEPLAANVSGLAGRKREKRLATEQLRLLAPMLGVGYDDLLDRKRKARNRRLLAAGAAVLTAALVFLGYAVNRMQVIAGQNRELSAQYETAAEARDEASRQKDAAYEAYARTVGLEARSALAKGESEKALEILLEILPDRQDMPEIREALEDTLRTLCAGGYVPAASGADYLSSRGIVLPKNDYQANKNKISLPPPPEAETEEARVSYDIRVRSEEYGFQIATRRSGGEGVTLVHFPEEPEKDYFLRDPDGNHYFVQLQDMPVRNGKAGVGCSCMVLGDGTVIDIHDGEAKRADPRTGRFIPFFDEESGGGSLAEKGEKRYTNFLDYDGCDVLIALTETGAEIWQRSPFRYLYTTDAITDIIEAGGKQILVGSGKGLTVFARNPFRELYTIGEEEGADPVRSSVITAAECTDGQGYLTCGWTVYDSDTGGKICSFDNEGAMGTHGNTYSPLITSDGMALVPGFHSVSVWDLKNREQIAQIRSYAAARKTSFGTYQAFGRIDPESGLQSSSAILLDGLVYIRREKQEIPESIGEQIALAKELLQRRAETD